MRVLLTGADGFIGRHLASAISTAGHQLIPVVFGRDARDGELKVDLTDASAVAGLPAVDAVVHAAGVVDPKVSRARTFAVNLGATRTLVRWASTFPLRHFVHISSVAVYGPLLLGGQRSERTPRLGTTIGLPYMQSKALAERAVERANLPYSLLRPPAVVGAGDSVVSPGFLAALCGSGLPLMPGASFRHMVSLALVDGLCDTTLRVLDRGPLYAPVHTIDAELPLQELAELYASRLGRPCNFARTSLREAFLRRDDAGFSWLVASSRFGQHYTRDRQLRWLGTPTANRLESAVQAGLSSLQGIKETLF